MAVLYKLGMVFNRGLGPSPHHIPPLGGSHCATRGGTSRILMKLFRPFIKQGFFLRFHW